MSARRHIFAAVLLAIATLALPSHAWAQSACGSPTAGSCLEGHVTPGCSNAPCCQVVCAIYPDCCLVAWDEFCVQLADQECPFLCGSQASGDCYVPHPAPACNDAACCSAVCAVDPACCQYEWDLICTFEVEQFCTPPDPVACGDGNAGSCTVPHGTPSCANAPCCQTVCTIDPSCCTQAWDVFCVQLANTYCFSCNLNCPADSVAEVESCGNRTNDVCVSGQAPQAIACGSTVCGTVNGTIVNTVWNGDRDAFSFTAVDTNSDGAVNITVRLAAEFTGFAALVPATCPVQMANALLHVNATNCLQTSATICVPPGNYWIIVAPGTFPTAGQGAALDCLTIPRYSLALECSQLSCTNPCSATSGPCFSVHNNPGCETPACCTQVCALDPYCCAVSWDTNCVISAGQLCGAPVPTNDDCGNALAIATDQVVQFNTVAATISQPPVPASCEQGQGINIGRDVWYTHVATCSGNLSVDTCGSATDMRILVYTGACGVFTLVTCNTDSVICSPTGGARVQFVATCGETYYIRVGGDTPSDLGTGQLVVHCPGPACPGACPADLNHDGNVDGGDLGSLLGAWGTAQFDLTGDGTVDGADLGALLGAWGLCPH